VSPSPPSGDNRTVHDDIREGSGPRALVVDDAPEFRELLGSVLRRDGFRVDTAGDGDAALAIARSSEPDVVVLDIGLPGIDGVEVCRRLRTFSDAYVVMVTGRGDEVDKLIGLSVGADDYVTKPFSNRELVARIRAMLRRPRGGAVSASGRSPVRRLGGLEVDTAAREVRVDGQVVELTRIEFDMLDALSAQPRVALSVRGRPRGRRAHVEAAPEAGRGLARAALRQDRARGRLPARRGTRLSARVRRPAARRPGRPRTSHAA
jgi:DNA-binding response OmpR family regulator